MQKYTDLVLGQSGQSIMPVTGATVTVLNYPGGTPATIYSDNGVTQTNNPVITDNFGRFYFYAANGRYSLQINYQTVSYTLNDIPLLDDPTQANTVIITGGTIDNTPIGSNIPSTGAFTSLSASGAVSGNGFIFLFANPPAIGATTPGAGTFSSLSTTSNAISLTPASTAPSANGQLASSTTQNAILTENASLSTVIPGVIFTQTASATTSGTSASTWLAAGVGTTTIPANYLVAGKVLRIRIFGLLATAATPGTLSLSFAIGSSTIWTSSAPTPTPSLTGVAFTTELLTTVRTTGSGGTCAFSGYFLYVDGSVAAPLILVGTSFASVAINTTVSNAISITSTNSVSGGAVLTITQLSIEMLN